MLVVMLQGDVKPSSRPGRGVVSCLRSCTVNAIFSLDYFSTHPRQSLGGAGGAGEARAGQTLADVGPSFRLCAMEARGATAARPSIRGSRGRRHPMLHGNRRPPPPAATCRRRPPVHPWHWRSQPVVLPNALRPTPTLYAPCRPWGEPRRRRPSGGPPPPSWPTDAEGCCAACVMAARRRAA